MAWPGGVLQFFGGGVPPNFWGSPNFRGGSPILGGLQILGGVSSKFLGWFPNFRGVSNFEGEVSNFEGGEYGQRSASTHPTGMHPCFIIMNILDKPRLRKFDYAMGLFDSVHETIKN